MVTFQRIQNLMLHLTGRSNPWSSEYQEYLTLVHFLLLFYMYLLQWKLWYDQMNAMGQLSFYILDKYS